MKTAVGDFYEDDEPVDELLIAFDSGERGVTAPPTTGTSGATLTLVLE